MFDKIKRRWLALWIRCPKKAKTKGDVLRYALKHYLKYGMCGLCYEIDNAVKHYKITSKVYHECHGLLYIYFPLFNQNIACRLFNGQLRIYWWPTKDWRSRYRYMRWLIREYNNVKL